MHNKEFSHHLSIKNKRELNSCINIRRIRYYHFNIIEL